MTKYVFVTGGVVSGLGKGITAAAIGCLLKARGVRVRNQKFDPYINVDPALMNPMQHGEIFITEDGAETDLDIGHYERFTDVSLGADSDVTSGMIYLDVINRERAGGYHGGTVQVVPHIINEIKARLVSLAARDDVDVVIAEIGGTVGDMEGQPYIEAIRELSYEVGRDNVAFVHVTLLPSLGASGEVKTKPTQHSVRQLLSYGVQPDMLVCRASAPIAPALKDKLAMFCNVPVERVIENVDCLSVYALPLLFEAQGLARELMRLLHLDDSRAPDLRAWERLWARIQAPRRRLKIALVGKYVALHDAYHSVVEALTHAGVEEGFDPQLSWLSSETFEGESYDASWRRLAAYDAVIAPGGFGERGMNGLIRVAGVCRRHAIPYLGIGLGMQMAVVEIARHEAHLPRAGSDEASDTVDDVFFYPPGPDALCATTFCDRHMRRGAYVTHLTPDTPLRAYYGVERIVERHHHRRELNPAYLTTLVAAGLQVAGTDETNRFVHAVVWPGHPFFVGTLYEPQLVSRPTRPHPLVRAFLRAAGAPKDKEADATDVSQRKDDL